MNVVLAASDPDRADALERAAARAGHRVARVAGSFAKDVELLNGADVVVADLATDAATGAWCVAYALARGRLVVVCTTARAPLPALLRGNPSPYQRIVVGETRDLEREVGELLRP